MPQEPRTGAASTPAALSGIRIPVRVAREDLPVQSLKLYSILSVRSGAGKSVAIRPLMAAPGRLASNAPIPTHCGRPPRSAIGSLRPPMDTPLASQSLKSATVHIANNALSVPDNDATCDCVLREPLLRRKAAPDPNNRNPDVRAGRATSTTRICVGIFGYSPGMPSASRAKFAAPARVGCSPSQNRYWFGV